MKRFLLLFCAVSLVCSFMIVPALAAESYQIEFSDCSITTVADFVLPSGTYVATIYDGAGTVRFTSEPFDFTGKSMPYSLMDDDTLVYELWIDLRPEDGQTAFEVVQVNDEYFNVWTEDRCVVFTLVLDEPVVAPVPVPGTGSVLSGITEVFSGVGSWIGGQLGSTTSLFWNANAGSLTFLGVLSVCALAFGLILLLVLVVSRFLRFG